MIGDDPCVRADHLTPTRIACRDENGNLMGYRDALTEYELRLYASRMAQAQLEYQQSMEALAESNRQLSQTTQQIIESNAQRSGVTQPEAYDWQQQKKQYVAQDPEWTERIYEPSYSSTPVILRDKRWDNGVLWCIYSNDQVRQAEGVTCPNRL